MPYRNLLSGHKMKRRGSKLTSFFFLVVYTHIRTTVQQQTNSNQLEQLDTVLQNIDKNYRKVWLQDSTMTKIERSNVTVLPWSLTDPTGVYSPVKAISSHRAIIDLHTGSKNVGKHFKKSTVNNTQIYGSLYSRLPADVKNQIEKEFSPAKIIK